MTVLFTMYLRNRLSRAMMSGSGYWTGSCLDQSLCAGVDETCGCCSRTPAPTAAARNIRRFMPPIIKGKTEHKKHKTHKKYCELLFPIHFPSTENASSTL